MAQPKQPIWTARHQLEGHAAGHQLDDIRAARLRLTAAEGELSELVHAARAAGYSWALIAAELGVTRQSAAQRFAEGKGA